MRGAGRSLAEACDPARPPAQTLHPFNSWLPKELWGLSGGSTIRAVSADQAKPNFTVEVDGSPISESLVAALIQLTVDEPLDQAAVCVLKFRDDSARHSSDHPFKVGAELKVGLGYVGTAATNVFEGQVTGHKGVFPRRGNPTFSVVAHDRFHLLRRNRRSKTSLKVKDSDVIAQAAQAAGLSAGVTATSVTHEAILQFNQSDADFVLERAAICGYETYVEGKKLVCRPPALASSPVATLIWHEELRHFETTISVAGQHKELTAKAWDMQAKALVTATVKDGGERDKMGGTETGAKFAASVFPQGGAEIRAGLPARTQAEIKAYAEARFRLQSERFLRGEGACQGNPKIRRGTVVEIDEIGDHLAGPYYVRRAIHTLTADGGYTTTFRVLRTAVKRPAVPAPEPDRPPPPAQEPFEATPDADPLVFEVGDSAGAPLAGAPFVIVDPEGKRSAGELSSDGKVEVEFED